MSQAEIPALRTAPEPLPANITGVQPGGGFCCRLELAWGRGRRWYLRTFRPRYVRRMAETRQGTARGCAHEVLDPRDLKYCRNLCDAEWAPADDPFRWRGRLGLARWGLAELVIMGVPLVALTLGLAVSSVWYLALVPAVVLAWLVWFFRDPARRVPAQPGQVVAPADGTVVEVTELDHDEWVGGPAVRIGVFLSIFNVHINRAPVRSRAIRLRYSPGRFLNALNPESALANESMWIGLEEDDPPHRRLAVRQVAGLLARRIVCDVRPGELLERGHKFGMIKLGSRTELVLPAEQTLVLSVAVGQKIHAGSTVVAHYNGR